MQPNQDKRLSRALEILDNVYEQKLYESADVDSLGKEFSLSRPQVEVMLTPLYAKGWIENDAEGGGGYFRVRLSAFGKEQLDRANGNTENEQIRTKLLDVLAKKYAENPHAIADSEQLTPQLGLDWNKVCFNLKILEMHGLVRLKELYGAGHASCLASLTPEGKYAHDNPEPVVVFLSHAAVDEEIAKHLKEVLQACFPRVDVFVSSDPEDLPPGDPWVQTILGNLAVSRVVLVLATDRGMSRKWVWFETGAGWSRNLRIIPCCLGRTRKGRLAAPFSSYQALNIDEEGDLRILIDTLSKQFDAAAQLPDFRSVASNLTRLDVRAEERERLSIQDSAADTDNAGLTALILELEDNLKDAAQFQTEHRYVAPSNTEWLNQRASLKGLPSGVQTELTAAHDKIRRWKVIADSGIHPLTGSMEIPKLCKELKGELPPLIAKLKQLIEK
jgi:DNA-binding transcriptional ArsR family regulator